MTDADLAAELAITLEQLATFTPTDRAAYERLVEVARALNRGERPAGVMVDGSRRRGR